MELQPESEYNSDKLLDSLIKDKKNDYELENQSLNKKIEKLESKLKYRKYTNKIFKRQSENVHHIPIIPNEKNPVVFECGSICVIVTSHRIFLHKIKKILFIYPIFFIKRVALKNDNILSIKFKNFINFKFLLREEEGPIWTAKTKELNDYIHKVWEKRDKKDIEFSQIYRINISNINLNFKSMSKLEMLRKKIDTYYLQILFEKKNPEISRNYCMHVYPDYFDIFEYEYLSQLIFIAGITNLPSITYVAESCYYTFLVRRSIPGKIYENNEFINQFEEFTSHLLMIDSDRYGGTFGSLIVDSEAISSIKNLNKVKERYSVIKIDSTLIKKLIDSRFEDDYKLWTMKSMGIIIKKMIKSAFFLGNNLENGLNVIIDDLGDFTLSFYLSSLIKLISNKYYCTFNGFFLLIIKEWINYRFDFQDVSTSSGQKKTMHDSTVFFAWLMCVKYLHYVNPECFGFKESLIDKLMLHSSSGMFFPFCISERRNILQKLVNLYSKYSVKENLPCSIYKKYLPSSKFGKNSDVETKIFTEETFKDFSKTMQKKVNLFTTHKPEVPKSISIDYSEQENPNSFIMDQKFNFDENQIIIMEKDL